MAGFEPATHHYFVGHCTVYPAAGPLAPQGDSLKNNPLAQIQLPFGDRKHSCLQPHLYKTALRAALYRINRFGSAFHYANRFQPLHRRNQIRLVIHHLLDIFIGKTAFLGHIGLFLLP